MRFTNIRGWNHIEFNENDIFAPQNYDSGLPVQADYIRHITEGGVSSENFFSKITVADPFEKIHNLKYIELTLEDEEKRRYTYYGWVDSVQMLSIIKTAINWRIDLWRTYWPRVEKIRGWITRRRPNNTYWDPPQDVPTNYLIPTGDIELLGYQFNRIQWIIITFAANLGELGSLLSTVNKIPLVGGVTSAIKKLWDVPAMLLGDADTLNDTKSNIPYYPAGSPDVFCLTFPIMLQHDGHAKFKLTGYIVEREYVRDMRPKARNFVYTAPSIDELVGGDLMLALGIKADKVLSCAISPICPLEVVKGTGSEKNPVVVKSVKDVQYGFHGKGDVPSLNLVRYGENGYLQVNISKDVKDEFATFGVYDVGPINKGCPELKKELEKFYFDPRYTQSIETSTDVVKIVVGVGSAFHGQYIRLCDYVRLLEKRSPALGIIRGTQDNPLELYHVVNPAGDRWKCTSRVVNGKTVWTWQPNTHFVDIEPNPIIGSHVYGVSDLYYVYWEEKGDERYSRVYNKNSLYLKLKYDPERKKIYGPDIVNVIRDDLLGIAATRFAINAAQPRYFINSSTLMWPVHYIKLKRPMMTDNNRILVLIGPRGEILHRFRPNQVIESYTYEVVIAQTDVYIRFKFNEAFAMAADAEVTVPLQSIPLPTNQMNEYLANGTRMLDIMTSKATSENQGEKNKEQAGWNLANVVLGAVSAGGPVLGMAAKIGVGAAQTYLNYKESEAMRKKNDALSDRMQQLKDAKEMSGGGMMAVQGTFATAHDPVPLCLTYLVRDAYSIQQYNLTTQITGISVNERSEDIKIREGPLQVRQAMVFGKDIPTEGITYIASRLEAGVFICHNPKEFY